MVIIIMDYVYGLVKRTHSGCGLKTRDVTIVFFLLAIPAVYMSTIQSAPDFFKRG